MALNLRITSQVGSTGRIPLKKVGLIACPHLDTPGIVAHRFRISLGDDSHRPGPIPACPRTLGINQGRHWGLLYYTNSQVDTRLLSHVGAPRPPDTQSWPAPVQSTPRHCSLKSLSKLRGVLSNLSVSSSEASICILQRMTVSRQKNYGAFAFLLLRFPQNICFNPTATSPADPFFWEPRLSLTKA